LFPNLEVAVASFDYPWFGYFERTGLEGTVKEAHWLMHRLVKSLDLVFDFSSIDRDYTSSLSAKKREDVNDIINGIITGDDVHGMLRESSCNITGRMSVWLANTIEIPYAFHGQNVIVHLQNEQKGFAIPNIIKLTKF
jgi:hypothetical protein